MKEIQRKAVEKLREKGEEIFKKNRRNGIFTDIGEAGKLVNNLEEYPHAFVLGSVMDRQIPAEKAWSIPYHIAEEVGDFQFSTLQKLKMRRVKEIFNEKGLHRFKNKMAENFYHAVQRIYENYDRDASEIWKGKPRSSTVVRRFLEFKGVGLKIATMATNILVRDFDIPIEPRASIDISPDVYTKRVFKRLGLISEKPSDMELIYRGRELNREYPGIFDLPAWRIGKEFCSPRDPNCEECDLNRFCTFKQAEMSD